jgi:flagellar hook-associated protein 1 FlgK
VANIGDTLALEVKNINREYETYSNNASGIDESRASVSGVSIDEETINMVMYNQSLAAASRFMTTIDESMDVIINKMGLVGR